MQRVKGPRHMRRHTLLTGFVSTVLYCFLLTPPASAASAYTVVEFGQLDEGLTLVIRGLNRAGEVTGGSLASGRGHRGHCVDDRQARRHQRTVRRRFQHDRPASTTSERSRAPRTPRRAFAPSSGHARVGFVPSARCAGDSSSEAFAINAKGDMVGYSSGRSGMRAVRWTRSGAIQALGLAAGGHAQSCGGDQRSRRCGRNVLGSSPGSGPSCGAAGPSRISARCRVIARARRWPSTTAARWWARPTRLTGRARPCCGRRGRRFRSSATLTGGTSSRALAINDAGEIVGASSSLLGLRAVLWTRTGGITDLNTTIPTGGGFVLMEAVAINQLGVIVALGQDDHGHGLDHGDHHPEAPTRVFLLTPVR